MLWTPNWKDIFCRGLWLLTRNEDKLWILGYHWIDILFFNWCLWLLIVLTKFDASDAHAIEGFDWFAVHLIFKL